MMIDIDMQPPAAARPRPLLLAVGSARRQTPRRRPPALRRRSLEALSAWDRAVADFSVAWDLSPQEHTVLCLALRVPSARLDTLVRELLVEAAGLAVETGRADAAAWCYAACERITGDAGARPTWDELAMGRSLLETLVPADAHRAAGEALPWWCVRLVPRLAAETPDDARRRTTVCALYLGVMAVRAFTAEDAASHERAGVVAALGAVVARRARAMLTAG